MKITEMSLRQLTGALADGQISAVEAARAYLDAVHEKEPQVGAYITVTEEAALAAAGQVDKARAAGEALHPLAGVPCGIKDNICTKGVATTCASRMLENFLPPYDAAVMEKLNARHRHAGQDEHG